MSSSNIQFDRKREEWSDQSSDEDESAAPARGGWEDGEDKFDTLGDLETVEYVDEMGRTRTGTRKEAREAEREKARDKRRREEDSDEENEGGRRFDLGAYAEVQ